MHNDWDVLILLGIFAASLIIWLGSKLEEHFSKKGGEDR
jgi:hypothetical protein